MSVDDRLSENEILVRGVNVERLLKPVGGATPLNGQVHARLREAILTGHLPPGTRLRPTALAEAFEVSPTPIREALLRLQKEGLVEASQRRWTRVAIPDPDVALQTYPLIGTLEAFALSTSPAANRQLIRKLTGYNETLRQAARERDVLGCMQADHEFHTALVAPSENQILIQILDDLRARIRLLEGELYRSAWGLQSAAEHERIIELLQEGEVNKAIEALQENWTNAGSAVVRALKSAQGAS